MTALYAESALFQLPGCTPEGSGIAADLNLWVQLANGVPAFLVLFAAWVLERHNFKCVAFLLFVGIGGNALLALG